MTAPRKSFIYIPDEYLDCGELGEHPVTFTAWIDAAEHGRRASVHITLATVEIVYGEEKQTLNVTPYLRRYPSSMEKWEDEIRESWEAARDADWDRGA